MADATQHPLWPKFVIWYKTGVDPDMFIDPENGRLLALFDAFVAGAKAETKQSRPASCGDVCLGCRGRGGWYSPDNGQWVTCSCRAAKDTLAQKAPRRKV